MFTLNANSACGAFPGIDGPAEIEIFLATIGKNVYPWLRNMNSDGAMDCYGLVLME